MTTPSKENNLLLSPNMYSSDAPYPIPPILLGKILSTAQSVGVPTGSQVFGVAHAASDVDYIIGVWEVQDLLDVELLKPYSSMINDTVSLKITPALWGAPQNLIIALTQAAYDEWCYATSVMKSFPREAIRSKTQRCLLFEALLHAYRAGVRQ